MLALRERSPQALSGLARLLPAHAEQSAHTPYKVNSCRSTVKPAGASWSMGPGQPSTSNTRSQGRQ